MSRRIVSGLRSPLGSLVAAVSVATGGTYKLVRFVTGTLVDQQAAHIATLEDALEHRRHELEQCETARERIADRLETCREARRESSPRESGG